MLWICVVLEVGWGTVGRGGEDQIQIQIQIISFSKSKKLLLLGLRIAGLQEPMHKNRYQIEI